MSEENPTKHPTRDELAAMTYDEWLAYHRAQPGGWLTTSAPDELMYSCYEKRLATFDAFETDAPDAAAEADADEKFVRAIPLHYGFEYEVRLAVSIPQAWAALLKQAAGQHYDDKCREAGERGVINGLYNTSIDGPLGPSTYAVSWRDLDLTTKVAEQIEHHTTDHVLVAAIRDWLRETMEAISKQRELCAQLAGSTEAV